MKQCYISHFIHYVSLFSTELMGTVNFLGGQSLTFQVGRVKFCQENCLCFLFFLKTPQVFTTLSWADMYEFFLIILKTIEIYFSI